MNDDVIDDHRFDNLLRLYGKSATLKREFTQFRSGRSRLSPNAWRIVNPTVEAIEAHYYRPGIAYKKVIMVAAWWAVNPFPHPGQGCLSLGSLWSGINPDPKDIVKASDGVLVDSRVRRVLVCLADNDLGICWSKLLSDVVLFHRYGKHFPWVRDYVAATDDE